MVETEIKIAVDGPATARRWLASAGFGVIRRRVFEANIVLDTPDLDLRKSGRLLRVRQAGKMNTLTVNGPAIAGPHKKRPEFETTVAGFEHAVEIFGALGYEPMFRYEKYRTEYGIDGEAGHAVLDETPIGTFLELEGPGKWIDATARRMGIRRSAYIRDSYGTLYIAYCQAHGLTPANMVFEPKAKTRRT